MVFLRGGEQKHPYLPLKLVFIRVWTGEEGTREEEDGPDNCGHSSVSTRTRHAKFSSKKTGGARALSWASPLLQGCAVRKAPGGTIAGVLTVELRPSVENGGWEWPPLTSRRGGDPDPPLRL